MGKIYEQPKENKNKGKVVDVLCAKCKTPTRHLVVVDAIIEGEEINQEEEWSVDWWDDYQVVQCQGCQTMSFRHVNYCSEYREDGSTERIYPRRDSSSLSTGDFLNAPNTLRRIYRETIECFNNECYTLCAAGLRSIVEGICADQGVLDGPVTVAAAGGAVKTVRKDNLEGKIFGLCEKGILTKPTAETLHEHRYLGNEAMHQLAQPSANELKLAIEIIVHTLEQLYEIPGKALDLKQKMAKRKAPTQFKKP